MTVASTGCLRSMCTHQRVFRAVSVGDAGNEQKVRWSHRRGGNQEPEMSLRSAIAQVPVIRPLAAMALRMTAKDIRIRHPWTGDQLYLNTYKHRTYWVHGRGREKACMERFGRLISEGDLVLDIGGHIGYTAQYFSCLVGEFGNVVVFEPGQNNLPYIRKNLESKANVILEELAASDKIGEATLYEDTITGQNNSLIADYPGIKELAMREGVCLTKQERQVGIVTIDGYLEAHKMRAQFIKMDIEGHELPALVGARAALRSINALMVEVTHNHEEVGKLLIESGLRLYNANGVALSAIARSANIFAVRSTVADRL